mgnify:FL=1
MPGLDRDEPLYIITMGDIIDYIGEEWENMFEEDYCPELTNDEILSAARNFRDNFSCMDDFREHMWYEIRDILRNRKEIVRNEIEL